MKITNLKIDKFRKLQNVDFKIGNKLTVIAGRNGTGKSALLGLIGHVFDYKGKQRTISGQKFATEFGKIFRFSLNLESNNQYSYEVLIDEENKKIIRYAYFNGYNETEKRFRIHVGKKESKQGKINMPVVYLGLERLFPIAQEEDKNIDITPVSLNDKEKKWYEKYYNQIFASEESVGIEDCKTLHKRFCSPSLELHDSFSNSAGEDNLGQILTSVLSFKKIMEDSGEKYKGGILLIDELDATLFPGAQMKLLETFLTFATKYSLQILFTTHSTDILKMLAGKEFSEDVEFLFLEKRGSKIISYQNKDEIRRVLSALRYEIFSQEENRKVELYTEDEEARIFFRNIAETQLKKEIRINSVNLGAEEYIHLIKKKAPIFPVSIVVLDGDKKNCKLKNVLSLPGKKRPEDIIYSLLKSLSPEDDFWGSYGRYNKEYFLANQPRSNSRDDMKKWFNKHKKHWGRGCKMVLDIWKEKNQEEIKKFNEKFRGIVDYIKRKQT